MTSMTVQFCGATYCLTTEHAASSYGVPVLVDEDGIAYGPADIVTTLAAVPAQWEADWFGDDGSAPARVITARTVVLEGDLLAADGEAFRASVADLDGYEALTDCGHAAAIAKGRFVNGACYDR